MPAAARAKIDLTCSSTTATSAIAGLVQNALGAPLPGMKVELYTTNRMLPTADSATTGLDGRYRICAGEQSGAGHDTYDVHVKDLSIAPLYGTANQPYTTYTNLLGDADFTPASGYPLLYMANLTVTPNAITTAAGPATVEWLVRSKAPAGTIFKLKLGHPTEREVTMSFDPVPEGAEPARGGWNRWRFTDVFPKQSTEKLYFSSIRGFDGAIEITQRDRQPYTLDNTQPVFGQADASVCGPGVFANSFSPASPPGTTNRRPLIFHDTCDPYANGSRSGLDPFSLRGYLCLSPVFGAGCEEINPVLSTRTITWHPATPLPDGHYYFRWELADMAGNVARNPILFPLQVGNTRGQVPFFTAIFPGNLGSGNASGVIVGSSVTTPNSYPYIGFRVLDADGQPDLVPGSLRLRVYYTGEPTIVYDYDPAKGKNEYDPVTQRGGADFDLSTGLFKATGFPLQGKPPGRYIASAAVTDFGGNSATMTWHFILAAAV